MASIILMVFGFLSLLGVTTVMFVEFTSLWGVDNFRACILLWLASISTIMIAAMCIKLRESFPGVKK